MNNILLASFISILSIILGLLIWLFQRLKKIRQDHQNLTNQVTQDSKELAGLYADIISIESQLTENNKQLKTMSAKLNHFEIYNPPQTEMQADTLYQNAIQKIHAGANVEELVRFSGLNKEEALLMIRLHADKPQ